MSFDEDFPSLKGKNESLFDEQGCVRDKLVDGKGNISYLPRMEYAFTEHIVKEHCLDKQRVRGAMDRLDFDESGKGDLVITHHILLKELGLEDV